MVLTVTSGIATLGTGLSTLSLLFIGMAIYSDDSNHRKIAAALVTLGLVMMIVAPLFFMYSQPKAILNDLYDGDADNLPEDYDSQAESFFGSHSNEQKEKSWGGGIGWFLSFAGAFLLLASLILMMLNVNTDLTTIKIGKSQSEQSEIESSEGEKPSDQPQQNSVEEDRSQEEMISQEQDSEG